MAAKGGEIVDELIEGTWTNTFRFNAKQKKH